MPSANCVKNNLVSKVWQPKLRGNCPALSATSSADRASECNPPAYAKSLDSYADHLDPSEYDMETWQMGSLPDEPASVLPLEQWPL